MNQYDTKEGTYGNKHVKRYFTSYVIRDMQIKTTVRYYDKHIRMDKIHNTDNNKQ